MWCKRLLALWRAHKELPWISHLMTQCISVTCFFFFFAFVHWNSCHHGVSLLSSSLQCWKWNCITPMAIWGWLPKILDSVDSLPFCNKCKVVRFCVADPLACFEGLKPVCGWLPAHGFYPSAVCVCCRLCRIILCTILHESVILSHHCYKHTLCLYFSVWTTTRKTQACHTTCPMIDLVKPKLLQQPPAKHNALKNIHENCSHQRWETQAGGDWKVKKWLKLIHLLVALHMTRRANAGLKWWIQLYDGKGELRVFSFSISSVVITRFLQILTWFWGYIAHPLAHWWTVNGRTHRDVGSSEILMDITSTTETQAHPHKSGWYNSGDRWLQRERDTRWLH